MDARTELEMIVVGHELEAKRRAAAAARQAKVAQQRRPPQTSNETRTGWLAGIRISAGGLALWKKLKGVVIG
ncbi:MAG TPA: hypothetical protein VLA19_23480, partial [Herpetosiphonaceae bacterium]|nr:hypothetical protein [Herpetosiphonaceae bacterium]